MSGVFLFRFKRSFLLFAFLFFKVLVIKIIAAFSERKAEDKRQYYCKSNKTEQNKQIVFNNDADKLSERRNGFDNNAEYIVLFNLLGGYFIVNISADVGFFAVFNAERERAKLTVNVDDLFAVVNIILLFADDEIVALNACVFICICGAEG